MEQCIQERQKTKWRFKVITNVKNFAALFKNIPMGCPDSVLPESLLRQMNASELSFIQQRQESLQRSFSSFPRIGHIHERTQ